MLMGTLRSACPVNPGLHKSITLLSTLNKNLGYLWIFSRWSQMEDVGEVPRTAKRRWERGWRKNF
jgi:hypothetical protein